MKVRDEEIAERSPMREERTNGTEALLEKLIVDNLKNWLKIFSHKFIADFQAETMEIGRQWNDIFKMLKENYQLIDGIDNKCSSSS